VGRHTAPGTGAPEPDRGFWARLVVAAVVVVLLGGLLAAKVAGNGEDGVRTATRATSAAGGGSSGSSGSSAPSTPSAAPSPSPGATSPMATSPAPSPTATTRPPTLSFTVKYPAYITVRVPGGRTLVSKLFTKGASRSFDKPVLEVVNGRPDAVRFVVNGKPRKPGPSGQTETFVVRRAKG
jgi:hypothetical protein